MDALLEEILKDLAIYTFNPIAYDFDQLTATEKLIVKSPENLAAIAKWASSKDEKFEPTDLRTFLFRKAFELIEQGKNVIITGDEHSGKYHFTSRVIVASTKYKQHVSPEQHNPQLEAMKITHGNLAVFQDIEKLTKRNFVVEAVPFVHALVMQNLQTVICTTKDWVSKQRPPVLSYFEIIAL